MATTDDPARLVFLHGFTQSHHHWHDVAHRVANALANRPTLAFVDLPGHGLAGDDRTPIADAGPRLIELAGRGTYVGYSMGGRFALHAALADPSSIDGLVLIGASPGIADAGERAARRRLDGQRAAHLEAVGVEAFVAEWLRTPMFADLPIERAGVEHRLRNTATGLASSLLRSGTGAQASLWDQLDRVTAPTLIVAGALDEKFAAIGRRMADVMPAAQVEVVAGAGHAVHAERPDVVAGLIARRLTTPA